MNIQYLYQIFILYNPVPWEIFLATLAYQIRDSCFTLQRWHNEQSKYRPSWMETGYVLWRLPGLNEIGFF